MGKFKMAIILTKGEKLKTVTGIVTDWIFVQDDGINHKTGKRFIIADCKCGKRQRICLNNVRSGSSKCCGKKPCRTRKCEKDPETGYRAILYVYKKHAHERNFKFDLTLSQCKTLFLQNCIYCGIKPEQIYRLFYPRTTNERTIPVLYNGIDRIDSKKGYSLTNCVPCCKICNRAKSDMSLEEFEKWIERLTKNQKKNGTPNNALKELRKKVGRTNI